MAGVVERIRDKAFELLGSEPKGIRYGVLIKLIHASLPDANLNTIFTVLADLPTRYPDRVYRPERGLFRMRGLDSTPTQPAGTANESDFYQPFAVWLVQDVEECTRAVALGGNRFKDKWGTPDVIGVLKSRPRDLVQFPTEIISAEIKTDARELITSFGQACAYRLFSHKSYIVVPRQAPQEDLIKIEALCLICGIGLVIFDNANATKPDFAIRVRPTKHDPDMFYVNQYLPNVETELFPA